MPVQKPGKSKQDYGTPLDFIAAVEKRFGTLDVDLAATAENTKALFFITPEEDSLRVSWRDQFPGTERYWLNPPFGRIEPWAEKCAREAPPGIAARIFFLVPASVGANWWHEHVHGKALALLLSPRLCFQGETQPYPKDCALCVYGEKPGYEPWRWK